MSATYFWLAHPDWYPVLKQMPNRAARMGVIKNIRQRIKTPLAQALQRVPVASEDIIEAYRANGIEPIWDLLDDQSALEFCARLRDYEPSPKEQKAAELLEACIYAEQAGDVIEFANQQARVRQREVNKVGGRALKKLTDAEEQRIAKRHRKLVESGGPYGATKALAGEFNVSRQTINRVVKKYAPNSIDK